MSKRPKGSYDVQRLRQDIVFREQLLGHEFEFHTTWGLFSPKGIDEGSRLLLKHLNPGPEDRVLDLGCGYGALGIPIAHKACNGHCLMVDKDFVAVDYANANTRRNGVNERLVTGGTCYVVVISGLRQFIARLFQDVFGNHTKVKQGRQYTVAMAQKPDRT